MRGFPGFPRIRGIFGDRYNEDYRILRSFLRSPVLRKIDSKSATIHVVWCLVFVQRFTVRASSPGNPRLISFYIHGLGPLEQNRECRLYWFRFRIVVRVLRSRLPFSPVMPIDDGHGEVHPLMQGLLVLFFKLPTWRFMGSYNNVSGALSWIIYAGTPMLLLLITAALIAYDLSRRPLYPVIPI